MIFERQGRKSGNQQGCNEVMQRENEKSGSLATVVKDNKINVSINALTTKQGLRRI